MSLHAGHRHTIDGVADVLRSTVGHCHIRGEPVVRCLGLCESSGLFGTDNRHPQGEIFLVLRRMPLVYGETCEAAGERAILDTTGSGIRICSMGILWRIEGPDHLSRLIAGNLAADRRGSTDFLT